LFVGRWHEGLGLIIRFFLFRATLPFVILLSGPRSRAKERLELLQKNQQKTHLILEWHILEAIISFELLHIKVNVLILSDDIIASNLQDRIEIFREQ
jgi:hypothetical protein